MAGSGGPSAASTKAAATLRPSSSARGANTRTLSASAPPRASPRAIPARPGPRPTADTSPTPRDRRPRGEATGLSARIARRGRRRSRASAGKRRAPDGPPVVEEAQRVGGPAPARDPPGRVPPVRPTVAAAEASAHATSEAARPRPGAIKVSRRSKVRGGEARAR